MDSTLLEFQNKDYKIPLDLQKLYIEYVAYNIASEQLINARFNAWSKVIKAVKKEEKIRYEFWKKVYKLYPELKDLKIKYDVTKGIIIVERR